jgi:hypothetical protein
MVLTIDSLAARALVQSTPGGAVLQAGTGMLAGIAQIAIVSWIQRRVEPEMMGRSNAPFTITNNAVIACNPNTGQNRIYRRSRRACRGMLTTQPRLAWQAAIREIHEKRGRRRSVRR